MCMLEPQSFLFLLRSARASQTAQNLLLNEVRRSYIGFARSRGLSYADAEDVSQRAMIRFWKKFTTNKIDTNDNPINYTFSIIRTEIFAMNRSNAKRKKYFESYENNN